MSPRRWDEVCPTETTRQLDPERYEQLVADAPDVDDDGTVRLLGDDLSREPADHDRVTAEGSSCRIDAPSCEVA